MRSLALITTTLALATALSGCAPLLIGGAAAGAAAAHDRRSTTAFMADQSLELGVANALHEEPSLKADTHINVTSYNLQVLLTGEVPSRAAGERVAAVVRSRPEVRTVFNELVIAPPSSLADRASDSLITTKVKAGLVNVNSQGFDPTRVKVVTERGIVYLMGLLRADEADAVTEEVRRVGGVRKVVRLFEISQ